MALDAWLAVERVGVQHGAHNESGRVAARGGWPPVVEQWRVGVES